MISLLLNELWAVYDQNLKSETNYIRQADVEYAIKNIHNMQLSDGKISHGVLWVLGRRKIKCWFTWENITNERI